MEPFLLKPRYYTPYLCPLALFLERHKVLILSPPPFLPWQPLHDDRPFQCSWQHGQQRQTPPGWGWRREMVQGGRSRRELYTPSRETRGQGGTHMPTSAPRCSTGTRTSRHSPSSPSQSIRLSEKDPALKTLPGETAES